MFSGLVWSSVKVVKVERRPGAGILLQVNFADLRTQGWALGDSIAINGVCLTIIAKQDSNFDFEVSPETLERTTLGQLRQGDQVHLEPAMALGDRIGGHLVSGHVDAVAPLSKLAPVGDFWQLEWKLSGEARDRVAPFLVEKGSIAVDGVSLTVNAVRDTDQETFFDVMLIPHTLEVTQLGQLKLGGLVNLEADMIAKYVNRAGTYQARWGNARDK